MKNLEIIADNLRSVGWTVSYYSFVERDSRILWRVGAHRAGGPQFTIQADNLSAALVELDAVCQQAEEKREIPTSDRSKKNALAEAKSNPK